MQNPRLGNMVIKHLSKKNRRKKNALNMKPRESSLIRHGCEQSKRR